MDIAQVQGIAIYCLIIPFYGSELKKFDKISVS